MGKKIVIIGGGVAGMTAGIYAALNGFDTEIIEMHSQPGGQCTAWNRKGYRFDYCLHWLVGTSKGVYHDIWKETDVLNDKTVVLDHEIHSCQLNEKGEPFYIYSNLDKWEKYLLQLAPEDVIPIRKMCSDIRNAGELEPFERPSSLRSISDYIKAMKGLAPSLSIMLKYGKLSCAQYFGKLGFTNETLKAALMQTYGESNFSAIAFIFMLGWFHHKNAGYIMGGSLLLSMRMAERFKSYGGKFRFNQKVSSIIVENGQATGVTLADGTTVNADYVIGTADGYTTLYKMLGGNYLPKPIKEAYAKWPLFTPLVQVSFGINKPISSIAPIVNVSAKGIAIGQTILEDGYSIMDYSFDPSMAPNGKTTLIIRFNSPWKLWESIDKISYKQEKQAIERDALALLEKQYPDISKSIEVIDVSTPLTDVRYTGVKEGAYEGFLPTKDNMMKTLNMTLPGLGNFYMAGQWLSPGGGLPPSAQTGKWAVQLICKKERMPFASELQTM